jgi:hypothetical protein
MFYLLDTVLQGTSPISRPWAFGYIPFGIAYAFLELTNGMDLLGGKAPLTLITAHLAYCLLTLCRLAYGYIATLEGAHFKVTVYGLFLLPPIGVTLLTEVLMKCLNSHSPAFTALVYQPCHVLSALVILFMLHPEGGGKVPPSIGRVQGSQIPIDDVN